MTIIGKYRQFYRWCPRNFILKNNSPLLSNKRTNVVLCLNLGGFLSCHVYYIKSNTKYPGKMWLKKEEKMFRKDRKKSRKILRRIFKYKHCKNSRVPNSIDIVQ